MRERRPEQFSDTYIINEAYLDRGYFEYHLDTLTSRGEEKIFEHFARKLCEKMICPNLIPQTGPTGGGDSKVDTENHPVSTDIADRWFLGTDTASARWGFAFSAKQDWRPKCKSDVVKIAGTGRGYEAVYFVSNQFVPDRKRAELEDELTKEHGFTVRILDRSWLVEAVLDKGNEDLAIETLQLSIAMQPKKNVGVGDQQKREQLGQVEARITDLEKSAQIDFELIDDCIEAAILSREIEEPREFTDGRFDRAVRFAQKLGNDRQILSVIYQQAWTACYWFDDFEKTLQLYDEIERRSLDSKRVEDVECAVNIWQTLFSLTEHGHLPRDQKFNDRTEQLLAHLKSVANDFDRPNNAANASGFLLLMQVSLHRTDHNLIGQHIKEFAKLFKRSKNLGGFQFHRFREIFEMLGDGVGEHPAYDEAFEKMLAIVETRTSETAAGDQLFKRGLQKVQADQPYDAIRFLGRAMARFIKHESQRRLEACLAGLAHTYSACGLYWAEYCALVSLTSMLFKRFETERDVKVGIVSACAHLTLNCLRTGNIPAFLFFFQIEKTFEAYVEEDAQENDADETEDKADSRDACLAIMLLLATEEQRKTLAHLPSQLEGLGLVLSCMLVHFMRQGQAGLRREKFLPDEVPDEDAWDMISQMLQHPARSEMAGFVELRDAPTVNMRSECMGIDWQIQASNNTTIVRVAQSFVGFIEAALSTSLQNDIMPATSIIRLRFVELAEASAPHKKLIEFRENESNDFFEVSVNVKRFDVASDYMTAMRDVFIELFGHLIGTYMMMPDPQAFLERIAGSEEGFQRALIFNDMVTTATNIFSNDHEETLQRYIDAGNAIPETVSAGFKSKLNLIVKNAKQDSKREEPEEIELGEGSPPKELLEPSNLSHRQRRVVSSINVRKWDRAKWNGVAVGMSPGYAPFLGLIFRDESAAISIFEEWRDQFGEEDIHDDIRVAIVRQLSRVDPHGYGVSVGGNFANAGVKKLETAISISRKNFMEHPNPQNLEMFLREYDTFGGYLLAPVISDNTLSNGRFLAQYGIGKQDLHVKSAWELSENDPDSMLLKPEHDPIIPPGVENPPVLRALERIKAMGERVASGLNRQDRRKEKSKKRRKRNKRK